MSCNMFCCVTRKKGIIIVPTVSGLMKKSQWLAKEGFAWSTSWNLREEETNKWSNWHCQFPSYGIWVAEGRETRF